MPLPFILAQLLYGFLSGACYLLIALGLSLIFSLSRVINMAQGALYAIGAYLALVLAYHVEVAAAFIAVPALVALLGIALERFLLRRFDRVDPALALLATFALAMVIERGLRAIFGAAPLSYPTPDAWRGDLVFGAFSYPKDRFIVLAIAAVAVTLTWLLIHRTPFGRVVRAAAQNADMLGALGIPVAPYRSAIAALGIALSGLAGALLASITTVHPAMGQDVLAAAFVVIVIGGLGSLGGLIAAALLVGVTRGLALAFEPAASEAAIYLLLVIALLVRPRGLFGAQGGERT